METPAVPSGDRVSSHYSRATRYDTLERPASAVESDARGVIFLCAMLQSMETSMPGGEEILLKTIRARYLGHIKYF